MHTRRNTRRKRQNSARSDCERILSVPLRKPVATTMIGHATSLWMMTTSRHLCPLRHGQNSHQLLTQPSIWSPRRRIYAPTLTKWQRRDGGEQWTVIKYSIR